VSSTATHQCARNLREKPRNCAKSALSLTGENIVRHQIFALLSLVVSTICCADAQADAQADGRFVFRKIIETAFGEMRFESITALLPPSRVRTSGMLRLGFIADGQVQISGSPFYRYRLWAPELAARQCALTGGGTVARFPVG